MNADEAVVALVGVLESLAIPYMVSGSLATNVYGVPRATDDGDFVLELPPGGRIADIAGALPEAIRLEPQVHFETVTASRMHVCTVADSAFRMELFLLTDDPYDRERFDRRYRLALPFGTVWMPKRLASSFSQPLPSKNCGQVILFSMVNFSKAALFSSREMPTISKPCSRNFS